MVSSLGIFKLCGAYTISDCHNTFHPLKKGYKKGFSQFLKLIMCAIAWSVVVAWRFRRLAWAYFSPQVISFNKRHKRYTRSGCSNCKLRYRFNIHLHHAPALKERIKRENYCSMDSALKEQICKPVVPYCIILELLRRQQNEERMDEKMDGM